MAWIVIYDKNTDETHSIPLPNVAFVTRHNSTRVTVSMVSGHTVSGILMKDEELR